LIDEEIKGSMIGKYGFELAKEWVHIDNMGLQKF